MTSFLVPKINGGGTEESTSVEEPVVTGDGGTGDTSTTDTSPVSPDEAADAFALIPGGGSRQQDPILIEPDQAPVEETTTDGAGAEGEPTKLERFANALTDQRWSDAWDALLAGSFTADPRAWPLWTWAALLALWAVIAFGASRRL